MAHRAPRFKFISIYCDSWKIVRTLTAWFLLPAAHIASISRFYSAFSQCLSALIRWKGNRTTAKMIRISILLFLLSLAAVSGQCIPPLCGGVHRSRFESVGTELSRDHSRQEDGDSRSLLQQQQEHAVSPFYPCSLTTRLRCSRFFRAIIAHCRRHSIIYCLAEKVRSLPRRCRVCYRHGGSRRNLAP